MRDRFTRVLKGHIALARRASRRARPGSQLDALARRSLWQAGLDFDHGTGHGVGCYLSVHEGPQRISKAPNTQPLQPGMIVSNEPGYYKTSAYGIRIENLVVVPPVEIPGAERAMLGFETLTLAPIDRTLVEPALLTDAERAWLDAYHARVRGRSRRWSTRRRRPGSTTRRGRSGLSLGEKFSPSGSSGSALRATSPAAVRSRENRGARRRDAR